MKKNILRGFASALALAVALVAPNVALAEESTEVDYNGGTQKIEKTYTNGNVDETVEFTFKLEYSYAEEINGIDVDDEDLESWSTTTTLDVSSGSSVTSQVTIAELLEGVTFATPGTYYFTLSEVEGDNPNVTYDTTTYTVIVEVVWASTTDEDGNVTYDYSSVNVASTTVYDSDGNKQGSADFKNTAANSASLKVTKDIQGSGANPEDTFTFTITVTGVSGTYTYKASEGVNVYQGDEECDGTVTADSSGTITVTVVMGDDDSFEILGLPVGAEYTVTEDATVTDSEGAVLRSYTPTGTVTSATALTASGATVAVTNTLGFTPDSGITLYLTVFGVVAVVAAAGIALVVVRRRRSYDEF